MKDESFGLHHCISQSVLVNEKTAQFAVISPCQLTALKWSGYYYFNLLEKNGLIICIDVTFQHKSRLRLVKRNCRPLIDTVLILAY